MAEPKCPACDSIESLATYWLNYGTANYDSDYKDSESTSMIYVIYCQECGHIIGTGTDSMILMERIEELLKEISGSLSNIEWNTG